GGQNVTVLSNGNAAFIQTNNGDTIDAFSFGAGGGKVIVGTQAQPITSDLKAGQSGIIAQGNGTVIVWQAGNITGNIAGGGGTLGIDAESSPGANPAFVFVQTGPGAIKADAGILALTTGTNGADKVTVNVGGNLTNPVGGNVTATNGNGVEADGVNG